MLIPLFPLILVSALAQDQVDPSDRGSALFQKCQTAVRLSDEGLKNATHEDFQDSASCLGYLDGFADATPEGSFCLNHATLGTMARIYVAYMREHPKLLDAYKSVGPYLAFQDAYPCPKK